MLRFPKKRRILTKQNKLYQNPCKRKDSCKNLLHKERKEKIRFPVKIANFFEIKRKTHM